MAIFAGGDAQNQWKITKKSVQDAVRLSAGILEVSGCPLEDPPWKLPETLRPFAPVSVAPENFSERPLSKLHSTISNPGNLILKPRLP